MPWAFLFFEGGGVLLVKGVFLFGGYPLCLFLFHGSRKEHLFIFLFFPKAWRRVLPLGSLELFS